MNPVIQYIIVFILLIITEITYFKIARKAKIYDLPNERSSHRNMTIRGGGIIFYVAILIYFIMNPRLWDASFFVGITIISLVSFIDDVHPLKANLRFIIQIIGFALILFQLNVFSIEGWKMIVVVFVCVCILNVYNFMDGINGMTGIYSLVTLLTLLYINEKMFVFVESSLIICVILADVVFLFFNFRNKAVCFAGDVGSICMGCVIIYLIARVIIMSPGDFSYMVLLVVYGGDGGFTVIRRLCLGKNIFHPHRSQIFQLLSNEGHVPQVVVSGLYAAIQLIINILYFHVTCKYAYMISLGTLFVMAHIFIYLYFNKKYPNKLLK